MTEIQMEPVGFSSNIAATGYDPQTNTLRVEFTNGKTADYYEVSAETNNTFKNSASKGGFFAQEIKGKYAWSYL